MYRLDIFNTCGYKDSKRACMIDFVAYLNKLGDIEIVDLDKYWDNFHDRINLKVYIIYKEKTGGKE
jgi:hypothetical protein